MLRELDRWRLLSNDIEIGVTLYREPDTAQRLIELARIEDALLASLREAAPDADQESGQMSWQVLNVRRLCDTCGATPRSTLARTSSPACSSPLPSPSARARPSAVSALRPQSADSRYLKLLRGWQEIEIIRERRMRLARALVGEFLRRRQGNTLLVTCKQGELEAALQADTTLADLEIEKWDVALSAALLYLDANEVLHLARGKAVFRAAMSIELNPEARRRQFSKSDYAELALHYKDKIVQVHVMAEYARIAIGKLQAAMDFVRDYFSLERAEFVRRYFAGRKDVLEMATTEAAHRKILTELRQPRAAGHRRRPARRQPPGAGWPGRGQDAGDRASRRLAAARMHGAARGDHGARLQPLRRQRDPPPPVGAGRCRCCRRDGADPARLAMRLTGTSYAVAIERGEQLDFDAVIRRATRQLTAAGKAHGEGAEASVGTSIVRDRLLAACASC